MKRDELLGADVFELDLSEFGVTDNAEPEDKSVQAVVQRALESAIAHHEANIEPDLVSATDYYHGRPFGDEEEGRSRVVSTDVADVTDAQVPSLMRIFYGPERVVEYVARTEAGIQMAEQATEYVNYVLSRDNPGFLIMHSAFKDALIRRLGVVKWWAEPKVTSSSDDYEQLTEEQLLTLATEEGVDLEITGSSELPGPDGAPIPVYDARVTRRVEETVIRVDAVPPEEFVFTPAARALGTSPLVAHVREVPADELLALGIDPKMVEAAQKHVAQGADMDDARNIPGGSVWEDKEDDRDPSQRPVKYAEAYMRVDTDGDGRSELRLFRCVGPKFRIANGDGLGEPVDEVPFAAFSMDPEPHTVIGRSNYDKHKDVQRVKSHVLRGMLDSLSLAIEPQLEVVENEVNIADILNPDIRGIIRTRRPGMLREIKHQFVGGDTLPVLEYYDEIKENRSGISKAAAGLDADSLQSSTKAAVAATLSASQQRIELIARIFAETGMVPLFRGLLRLVVKHQNRARTVKLSGGYVEVDPRAWDAEMEVQVNVGLGQGAPEDRVTVLQGVLEAQEKLMAAGSPLVTFTEIRATLEDMARLTGLRNVGRYFRPWTEADEQQMQQMQASQPPQPDPATMLAQAEAMKAQQRAEEAQGKLALEWEKLRLENDRERDRMAREFALKELDLQLKYNTQINIAQLRQQVETDRMAMDADLAAEQAAAAAAAPQMEGENVDF